MESHTADGELYNEKILETAKHNFKTKIGTEYTTKDVIRVWDCISRWIENNINRDKGILMKGIGYFTVAQWDIPVGKGYPFTIRKPVFVIDEKLAKDYNLKRKRPYNTGKIHEHYLNLLSVAHDYDLDPDMVQHCLKEVVTAFKKLLYEQKNCELPFPRIGKLQVKNKKVVMRFYRQFLDRQNEYMQDRMEARKNRYKATSYDPNWDRDQYKREERPQTSGSVISRPASSLSQYRPGTGYERVLPMPSDNAKRPTSRLSVCSLRPISRPSSNLSVRSNHQSNRPGSRGLSRQSSIRSRSLERPASSNHLSRPQTRASSVDLAKLSDKAEKETKFQDNCVDQIENNTDHLCYLCCKRKQRVDTINTFIPDSQDKDNFMKGDNPFGQPLNTDTENKRKMQLKDTSNYNYVTAKKLAEVIKNENEKALSEKNAKSYILYKRPKSVTENSGEKIALRQTLLDQIEEKKLKNNTNKTACLEDEKRVQEELIKRYKQNTGS
ncbi:coiled-coil domain-containing protein 81-like [Adelges cooleyi]|uniref:coiled-coil domain-containing protein 81-like n=1 Tax=Adelges cooleyi TaxID=133065 RepID=UPI0021806F60|nr:coiled-coil domain-containing protein 81-like [Adelges cooleyi]